ncbi:MAG: phage holin family protein [Anaerolineales bacterium]|nr:phage holin family protein [Anaerolineales bacterium]
MLFLPASPDEVMEAVGKILDNQRLEKKPSAWVFNECIAWEDQNRFEIVPVYGKFYHISAQARRVSEQEISLEDLKKDLQQLYRRYWSLPQILGRFLVGAVKLLGVGLLFMAVGAAHYGLSVWVGNVPAAGIIIGVLLAVVLVPQAAVEIWNWLRKRSDQKNVLFRQSILQRLRRNFFSRCPKCGRYLGNRPLDDDGSVRCECGYRIERKSPPA